jgi:hypothetical protein
LSRTKDEKLYEKETEDIRDQPQGVPRSISKEVQARDNPEERTPGARPGYSMSKKVNESLFYEEEIKDQPQGVPWSKSNKVRESKKPEERTSGAIPGDYPHEEEEAIEDRSVDIEYLATSGGPHVVSSSRSEEEGPGAAALGIQERLPDVTGGRRSRTPVSPGAVRVLSFDTEEGDEEDERTIFYRMGSESGLVADSSQQIADSSQQGIDTEEERPKAAVAQRRWIMPAAFVLVILIAVVLGIKLHPDSAPPPPSALSKAELSYLLSAVSSDAGTALSTPSTPQNAALNWLANSSNLGAFTTNETIIQQYALATLYYSANGDSWYNRSDWLSNEDLCDRPWYGVQCKRAGAVKDLFLTKNNLAGTIPPEIGLLSSSLGEFASR